ncbi:hypothetical protein STRTUCAR8_00200 [Streptomyces turgidiscabies Car8]|uniref:Uncharacterized protein n=1 Tax=Streptomyces turgidiscabies (strain Car8) TaxID=698760 RepID=L7ETG7_STRT8|nr:hypothetical protein STRTUCAR8_00200 [Streptomyces turgidiscabies Car8]
MGPYDSQYLERAMPNRERNRERRDLASSQDYLLDPCRKASSTPPELHGCLIQFSEHTSAAWATKARREPTRIVEAANAAAHDHYRNHPADALRELGLTG